MGVLQMSGLLLPGTFYQVVLLFGINTTGVITYIKYFEQTFSSYLTNKKYAMVQSLLVEESED